MTTFRRPDGGWRPPGDYLRPPLMAIGDSLLNGMRSCTITDAMAARSIPALVAGAIVNLADRARFQRALYPQPVLIDVEDTLRALPNSILRAYARRGKVFAAVRDNVRFWRERFAAPGDPDMPLFFDNIAMAGAEDFEVYDETASGFGAIVEAFAGAIATSDNPLAAKVPFPASVPPRLGLDDRGSYGPRATADLVDLHMGLNGRHLLNPRNEPALMGLGAIDQVALRRPRVLLHSLGHNSGLFDITLNGRPDRGLAALDLYARLRWPKRAETLAALPREIERIVVQLMPLPGQVPNLVAFQVGPNPLVDGYHDKTFPALRMPRASGTVWYDRAEMRRWDEGVRAVNATIRREAERAFANQPERLVIFDVPERFSRYDAKHGHGRPVEVRDGQGTLRFTNHGFAEYRGGGRGSRGGIASLDNHHPSGLGYALFARELALALAPRLPGVLDPALIEVTHRNDPLLLDPPKLAMTVLRLLWNHTTGIPFGTAVPPPAGGGDRAPAPRGSQDSEEARWLCETMLAPVLR